MPPPIYIVICNVNGAVAATLLGMRSWAMVFDPVQEVRVFETL